MTGASADRAACPVCNGAGSFLFTAGDRFYRVADYEARVFRCAACGSLFQSPIPDREAIASFYPRGYWREGEPAGVMARLQRRYVAWMLKRDLMAWFNRLDLAPGARVLDIGCSRGDWLALIRDRGFETHGLEADPRAAAYARERYGLDVAETDAESWAPAPAECDAALFFHLIEHVRDPRGFLAKCRRALRPGGRVLLRAPNPESLQMSLLGRRWKGLEMPRHIVLCAPDALRGLLEETGFRVTHWSTWSLRDGPPALASSLFPRGEPTRQQILGAPRPWSTLAYLALTWMGTPLEWAAAAIGRGSMATVIAQKVDA